MIDHELSFQHNDAHLEHFSQGKVLYRCQDHIFHQVLRNDKSQNRIHCFDIFGEYLRTLNVNILDSYAEQLVLYNHPIGNFQLIKKYLNELKRNPYKFIENLKMTLQ